MLRRSVLALSVLAVTAAAPAPAAAWERSCGSVVEHYRDHGGIEIVLAKEISTTEVRCRAARQIARAYASRSHYARTNQRGERFVRNRYPRAVGRFRCSDERLGTDIRIIACQDGSERVEFAWYDSSGYH
jgi:phage terminase large subunit-like protein